VLLKGPMVASNLKVFKKIAFQRIIFLLILQVGFCLLGMLLL
jgi:hypothetical protein